MRLKSGFLGMFSLVMLLSLAFLSSCKMEPDPILHTVTIQAPSQASLIVTSSSIGTQTVSSDNRRTFSIIAGETLRLTVDYNSSENNYSVYQWNGATKTDELNASAVISNDTSISVVFREQFSITFTAPSDSDLSITKESTSIKTIGAGTTDSITEWIGTELIFTLTTLSDSREIMIDSGNAEKVDRLTGTLEIASDDAVILSTSTMPYVTIASPSDYSIAYQFGNQESSVLPQGGSVSTYISTGSTLTVDVQNLDAQNFEVSDWDGLTSITSSSGTTIINTDTTFRLAVSRIQRILAITEPSLNAYVKIYETSELSGSTLAGSFIDGITNYSIGSGQTVYLSPQTISDSSFISWGSTVSNSNESPLPLTMDGNYSFSPAYRSTVVEPGIAYVSTTGFPNSEANGSKGLPYESIQDAINGLTTGEVRIAAGIYEIDVPIEMKPGVSLIGSYTIENSGSTWSAPVFNATGRGPGLSPTTNIKLKIIGAGTSTDYLAVGKFSSSLFTNSTIIKGISFEYDTSSRSYVAGLLFENGASPTIEHCRIISGTANQSSQGLRSLASSPKIRFTYVKAGEASSSIGVYNTGSMEVLSSEVETSRGGSNTIGMQNYQATGVLVENSSISSQGLNSNGFYGYSYGVTNTNSITSITDSDIIARGGGPTSSFGVTFGTRALNESASTSTVVGNTITTLESAFGGSGVAYYAETSPSVLFNNKISSSGGSSALIGLYLSFSNVIIGGNIIDVGRVTAFGGPVYGIFTSGSNPIILNNTIEGGDSAASDESSYGIYLGGGSAVITNNIIFAKSGRGPIYGIYGTSLRKPKRVDHNAFFDLSTAWFAPQGTTGVYYVTQSSEFTTSRTGLDESKTLGNIGEGAGATDASWSTSSIFNGYVSGDYSLHPNAFNSLKAGGVALTAGLIQSFIDELGATFSLTSIEIANLIRTDSAENQRNTSNWSMGAFQY